MGQRGRGRTSRPHYMRSMAAWRVSLAVMFAFIGLVSTLMLGTISSTALPVFQPQVANAQSVCPAPLALINESFEEPVIPAGPGVDMGPGWEAQGILRMYYVQESLVPGWETTAPSGWIQIIAFHPTYPVAANDGEQYVELNADTPSELFQTVDTTAHQGQTLTWSFAHKGTQRQTPALIDVARLKIGPAGGSPNFTYDAADTSAAWVVHSGTYTVPMGQTSTTFGWESIVGASTVVGNLLDSIQFGIESCEPALELDKTSDVAPLEALVEGDTVTYSFDVTNTGNVDLANVTVTDPLAGLSAITPTSVPELGVGETTTFTATYMVTLVDVNNGQITNTATALADVPEGCTGCPQPTDEDTLIVPPDQVPDIEVEKTSDVGVGEVLVAGDTVTYTFTVENTGNVTLTDVTVTDGLAGLSAIDPASVASLAPDATANFTATYEVTQEDVDAGLIFNSATTTGNPPPSCDQCSPPVSPPDELIIIIPADPSVSIVKTADTVGPVGDGDVITYTFEVANTGNVTIPSVTIADELSGLDWVTGPTIGPIPVGGSVIGTATYTVSVADEANGEVANSATVTCDAPLICEPVTPSIVIVPYDDPGLAITKDADPIGGVVAGDTITYTFTAENTGNTILENVSFVDLLDGLSWVTGPAVGTLTPGQTATGEATYVVTQDDVDNGGVTNVASGTCDVGCDLVPPVTVTVPPNQVPGLVIEKTADTAGPVGEGDVITYTFSVENTGTVSLDDVTISDTLAGLFWVTGPNVGTLAPGDVTTGEATYTVTADDVAAGGVTNNATGTGIPPTSCGDCPIPTTPPSQVFVPGADPGVTFTKTADTAGPVNAGDVITYTFTATNTGNIALDNVMIADQLAGLEWVTGPDLGTIAIGGSANATATYTVTNEDVVNGGVTNTASITCEVGCDVVPPVTVTVPGGDVPEPGTLTVEKTSDATGEEVHPGDLITYTFTVTNTGDSPVYEVTVTDILPGLSAIEGPHGTTLEAGASAVFTAEYAVTEIDADAGTIVNSATATGFDVTGAPVDDDDTVTLEACDPDGSVDPTPTPGEGTPEPIADIVADCQVDGAADCDGVPEPTEPPAPEPTKAPGGGGGGPVVKLPSTGQPNGGGSGLSPILPISVLILFGLAMTVSLIQRRKQGGK